MNEVDNLTVNYGHHLWPNLAILTVTATLSYVTKP